MFLTKEQKVQEEICGIANNIAPHYYEHLKKREDYVLDWGDILDINREYYIARCIDVLNALRDRGYIVINTCEW